MSSGSGGARRALAIAVAVVVVVLVAAGVLLLSAGAGDETVALDARDMAAIQSVISRWEAGSLEPWVSVPTARLIEMELPDATKAAIDAQYDQLKREVGTDEWINGSDTYRSLTGQMEGTRQEVPEVVYTDWEAKVLSVEFVTFEESGDAVVRVKVWKCSRGLHLDETDAQGNPASFVYDCTPLYLYTVRRVTDSAVKTTSWRLVSVKTEEASLDQDPKAYGPDTPHENLSPELVY